VTEPCCGDVEDAVVEYALGLLPPAEAEAVAAHLVGCGECRHQVDSLSELGDRLLDLVPDVEAPLGLDRRILGSMELATQSGGHRGGRRRVMVGGRRVMVGRRQVMAGIGVGLAAALVLFAVLAAGMGRAGHHHRGPLPLVATELSASLLDAGHPVGTVQVGGQPEWVTMVVSGVGVNGMVTCELATGSGIAVAVGRFELVRGAGSWSVPSNIDLTSITGARLVGPGGVVLATASFTSPSRDG
jgi:anti-sigma factor RsiW